MARIGWRGIISALCTIVNDEGELDLEDMRSLVRFNMASGAHGLAVSLMAGEFYKFSDAERVKTLEVVVDEANGKIPVLMGASHSGTQPTVALGKAAKDVGADGIIVMPPYFDKVEARLCLYQHFEAVASKVDLPIMIQDAEDVIGVHMCPSFLAKLAKEFNNITAVKVEGIAARRKIEEIRSITADGLAIFGGMAAKNLLHELRLGAKGNIPSSCLPDLLAKAYEDFVSGNTEAANEAFRKYKPWSDFVSLHPTSFPAIERETLKLRGVIGSTSMRGPRVMLDEEGKADLKRILQDLKVVPGQKAGGSA